MLCSFNNRQLNIITHSQLPSGISKYDFIAKLKTNQYMPKIIQQRGQVLTFNIVAGW